MHRSAAVLLALVLVVLLPASASAAPPAPLGWGVTIDGRPVAGVDANQPLVLGRTDPTRVVVALDNRGSDPVTVRSVRLDGRVLGLTFFSYSTRLDVTLAPGENTERQIDLDLDDLTSQGVGLLPARVRLLDNDRETIAEQSFPVQVRGSLLSAYGLFGLAVLAITIALVGWLLVSINRGTLPANRWQRALAWLPAGVGVGLTLTFFLSAVSLLLPSAGAWLGIVTVCAVAAFLVGYFLPVGRTGVPAQEAAAAPAHPVGGRHR